MPPIANVPLTQPWFRGLANIRGNLYSVIDFAGFLGRGNASAGLAQPARAVRTARRRSQRRHRRAARARAAQPGGARARGARRGAPALVRATLDRRRRQRVAGDRPRQALAASLRSCRSGTKSRGRKALLGGKQDMALKMPKLFGEPKAKLARRRDLDVPTTQVRDERGRAVGLRPAGLRLGDGAAARGDRQVGRAAEAAVDRRPAGRRSSVRCSARCC